MAQVDIGKIKIVWKGPWNSGTAYTLDDAVSHSGNSYICIQAGTNQNPSSATAYWQIMASAGTNGTDADLLNIASTAQGDIYYNNGSAIARLAPGTANQVLQTGGSGANPSWGTVSSEFVKINSTDLSTAAAFNFDNIFDDSTYIRHIAIIKYYFGSKSRFRIRWRRSGSTLTGKYYGGVDYSYRNLTSNTGHSSYGMWGNSNAVEYMQSTDWSSTTGISVWDFGFTNTSGTSHYRGAMTQHHQSPDLGGTNYAVSGQSGNWYYHDDQAAVDGFNIFQEAGANFGTGSRITILGQKK